MAMNDRIFKVNEFRNKLERDMLNRLADAELTAVELAYLLSELAFRYTSLALKEERKDQ